MNAKKVPPLAIRKQLPTKSSFVRLFEFFGVSGLSFLYHYSITEKAPSVGVSWSGSRHEDTIRSMIPVIEGYGFDCHLSPYKGEELRRGYLTVSVAPKTSEATLPTK